MAEIITRCFCMPNAYTFEMRPVQHILSKYIIDTDTVIDPFAGKSTIGTIRNDIRLGGVDARDFLRNLKCIADVVLLDPPYSPRQMSESYQGAGLIKRGCEHTQNARLYAECIIELDRLLRPEGYAIRFGWNALGFPKDRYSRCETVIIDHGGAHNSTIVTVDQKMGFL